MDRSRRALLPLLRRRRPRLPRAAGRHRRPAGRQHPRLVQQCSASGSGAGSTTACSGTRPPADRHDHAARRRDGAGRVAGAARAHAAARRAAAALDRGGGREQDGDGEGGPGAARHRGHVPAPHLRRQEPHWRWRRGGPPEERGAEPHRAAPAERSCAFRRRLQHI